MYHGDLVPSQVLYFHFTTVDSTGAGNTGSSLAISVYKDDSTTQSTAGVTTTFSSGFDGVAGLVSVKIDTSADGTFYAAGHDFSVVITTGTVNSVSVVGYVVGAFSIDNRKQKVDVDTIKTNPVVNAGTVTFPTTATLASTTNITAGTVATATNVTTVNGLAANVITAASIAADAIGASELAADAVNEIADGILNRDMSTGTDSGSTTVRTMRQALRFLRNKWSISGTTLTVTKEDDATASWTSTVSTDPSAVPVVGNDPAGP